LTVAEAIADLSGASGGDGGGLGPSHVDVRLSDNIAELFQRIAAERHRQIVAEQP
jgi:hypothetical protein